MVGINEYLIQAIVGKGLYEQYTQRQMTRADLARVHRNTQALQTQGRPHTSSLGASPTLGTKSDATNTPPSDLTGPKSASAMSSLKSRQLSPTISGRTPRPILSERALMPEYSVVHNHCSRITWDLESDDSTIMQSYEYGPLEIGPAIGFQAPTTHRRIYPPPRKITALERLPALSSDVVTEIPRRVEVREQAKVLAVIRKAQEKESERQRGSNRAPQMRFPPYLAHTPTSCIADEAALLSKQQPTPLTRRKSKQIRTQLDQHLGQAGLHASDAHKQAHLRWAPEPASRRRRDSTMLHHESHCGKRRNPRNGSRRVEFEGSDKLNDSNI